PMALDGLARLFATIGLVQQRLNPELRIAGILLFRVRPGTVLARQLTAALAERFPELLFPVVIRDTVRAAEAPARHQPLIDYAPLCSASADYWSFARAVLAQEQAA
ncbi:MAG TPA: hypothetical protein VHR45_21720, partial [Thermoanaerobaculia bacterium]|nr:hypothetical protein [Thermoanaerobaculia bacterium]